MFYILNVILLFNLSSNITLKLLKSLAKILELQTIFITYK